MLGQIVSMPTTLHRARNFSLALLIPAVLWLRYARRRPALNFSDGARLARLPRTWAVRLQPALPALFALGLLCLAVALARRRPGAARAAGVAGCAGVL